MGNKSINKKGLEKRLWILDSFLNSYSQIFFSLNKVLAIIILVVTFINPYIGLCGAMAILISNFLAFQTGLNKAAIAEGVYGFNALLLGLAIGFEYKFSFAFCIVFIAASLFLLINTVWLSTILGKYKLPFLGLPFLITYWLVYLSVGSFSFIHLQEQNIYTENFIANASQSAFYVLAHSLDEMQLPLLLKSYFKTLSATFFQNSVLAGIIIAAALLYFSRIAFSLSVIGFFTAYYFFEMVGVPTVLLTDYLVGSNFIFLAIAVGGFYLVPGKWSYLSVVLLIPVLCIALISFAKLLMVFQLKAFTLSFSLITIIFLFFVNNRWWQKFVQLVSIQYYSAEKTIYKHFNTTQRFKHNKAAKFTLPFWGEWKVSQGHKGDITHLGEWSAALDFVITDSMDKTWQLPGTDSKHFYSYNKPVLAPLEGFVYDVINNVEDNEINSVNTENNWGNTIILNHQNGLFTQISHLKKDSFKVKPGDYVLRGTVIAACGNSGRSPEPHIHFQVQLTPKIGEKTFDYPLAYYILRNKDKYELKNFSVPQENDMVSNVEINSLLCAAFDLQPGRTLRLRNKEDENEVYEWKVYTDAWNRTYLYCSKTKACLWFANDGIMFYCYDYEGEKQALLYDFYLAAYKLLLASYSELVIKDSYAADSGLWSENLKLRTLLLIQDFIAPFYQFLKADYQTHTHKAHNNEITIFSNAAATLFNNKLRARDYQLFFTGIGLKEFRLNNKIFLCDLF
ncbi:MAG: urea transporter [Bacteroidales bacterium]|nr:urea transporter [Bacteroidales bacterium]